MIAVGYYLKVLAPDNDLKDKLLLNLTILIVISDQLWALGSKKSFSGIVYVSFEITPGYISASLRR